MTIVVDQNIPFAESAFGQFGSVVAVPGRQITRDLIRNADALVVRSVTPVNSGLMEGTSVRFVATATNGVDHIDLDFLRRQNIHFASAAGANANAVAQWVVEALFLLRRRGLIPIAGTSLGIIGVGAIGSRLKDYADALGMRTVSFDPPRQQDDPTFEGSSMEEILQCDVVSLHVPLTDIGPHRTRGMVDRELLRSLKRGAILVNSSRGGVVPNADLLEWLREGRGRAVLDVWEGEPAVPAALIKLVEIATPHVAGYTVDARMAGTVAVARSLASWLGTESEWAANPTNGPADPPVTFSGTNLDALAGHILAAHDLGSDDRNLRNLLEFTETARGTGFDRLRRDYPDRREWVWIRQTS